MHGYFRSLRGQIDSTSYKSMKNWHRKLRLEWSSAGCRREALSIQLKAIAAKEAPLSCDWNFLEMLVPLTFAGARSRARFRSRLEINRNPDKTRRNNTKHTLPTSNAFLTIIWHVMNDYRGAEQVSERFLRSTTAHLVCFWLQCSMHWMKRIPLWAIKFNEISMVEHGRQHWSGWVWETTRVTGGNAFNKM